MSFVLVCFTRARTRGSSFCLVGGIAMLALALASSLAQAQQLAANSTGQVDKSTPSSAVSDDGIVAFIDAQIRAQWKDSGITPSMKAPDNEWCRRAYLDILGRVPTVEELKEYLATPGNKKAKLLDKLLDSEDYQQEFARNWTTIFTNLLVGRPPARRENNDPTNREGMQNFLRRAFLTGKSYDQVAYEIVSATGSSKPGESDYNGAVNFLVNKLKEDATEATSKTSKYFLGLQVQCTQCHNHPFNDWKQEQFWSMNAFFRQTKADSTKIGRDIDNTHLENHDFHGQGNTPREAEIYFELRNGTTQVAYPMFVDGTRINSSGYVNEVDRRKELGKLIIKSEYFGKAIANRMWAHFLGYGFTKPVDDLGPHNPPSHAELLDRMGAEFASHGHDLKRLMRWIVLSEAYGLSSKTTPKNYKDDPSLGEKPKFSHFYLRQMQAEELYESLNTATLATDSGSYEEKERNKGMWLQQFTLAFGNDEGDEATTFNGTIPQALMMMNGDMIKTATSDTVLTKILGGAGPAQAVEYLYLAALSRKPSGAELGMAQGLIGSRGDTTGYQDVWWALLNTNEFIFNH